mgnify:FL=1
MQLNDGDILGHEFCGVADEIGPGVKSVKIGKRYVASFQIACGEVRRTIGVVSRDLMTPLHFA